MKTVLDFYKKKKDQVKISMITCYDYTSALFVGESDIDCILVGDSVAMTMHGFDSTLPADVDMIASHTSAVARGASGKFLIADMPFLSTRMDMKTSMENIGRLMKAGANAVKIEGQQGHQELITHVVQSGIPVMGHLGLTPQSIHQFGGFKVQARDEKAAEILLTQSKALQDAGCFSLVLECVPETVAQKVAESLDIPVIGIGAGRFVDGQVLVFQDLLGLNTAFKPKFLRRYAQGAELFRTSINNFHSDVVDAKFPNEDEVYSS